MTTIENQNKTFQLWKDYIQELHKSKELINLVYVPSEKMNKLINNFVALMEEVGKQAIHDYFKTTPGVAPEELVKGEVLKELAGIIVSAYHLQGTSPKCINQ